MNNGETNKTFEQEIPVALQEGLNLSFSLPCAQAKFNELVAIIKEEEIGLNLATIKELMHDVYVNIVAAQENNEDSENLKALINAHNEAYEYIWSFGPVLIDTKIKEKETIREKIGALAPE